MEIPIGQVTLRIDSKRVMKANIEREGKRLVITFGFNAILKDEIKAMEGARWLGFEDPHPRKAWAVLDSERNRFQLAHLMGLNPYAPYDAPLIDYKSPGRNLYNHQTETVSFNITRRHVIVAEEMGCVDGEAVVRVNRARRGFQLTLRELFEKFNGRADFRGKKWDLSIPTYIRSLCGETLNLNRILSVLHKGYRPVLKLILKSGKSVRATADHEICTGLGTYARLDSLLIGDNVLANGRWIDKDGYMRVGGLKGIHPRWTTGGVYEHLLVTAKKIGRFNRVRHDNRIENLELLPSFEPHARLHGQQHAYANMHNGERVCFVPYQDEVQLIIEDGFAKVYDVVCDDPHRNFVANGIVVHNCGKSLEAIESMEYAKSQLGMNDFMWVGPQSALDSVKYEFIKWKAKVVPHFYTFEATKPFAERLSQMTIPQFLVIDEASRCKNPTAQRTQAIKIIADEMRRVYGRNSFIIEMTGTPAPKDPSDWYSLTEIACPGFLKEGNISKFKNRLALIQQYESLGGATYPKLITWWDDERKCKKCGRFEDDPDHDVINQLEDWYHPFQKSINEVKLLYERMRGLVMVKFKKDCLDLPEKVFRIVRCKPTPSVLRTASLITKTSKSVAKALILTRELSDGFLYQEIEKGTEVCPTCKGKLLITITVDLDDPTNPLDSETLTRGHRAIWDNETNQIVGYKEEPLRLGEKEIDCHQCGGKGVVPRYERIASRVECPKEKALIDILDQYEDQGRCVVWGGFTDSVDRCVDTCIRQGWLVARIDGRGWWSSPGLNVKNGVEILQAFDDKETYAKLVIVGHPGAGGMGLNLTASSVNVFYSNTLRLEDRLQAVDRINRPGADHNRGCMIIDLVHLPQDELVLQSHARKQDLMQMSMGMFSESLKKFESAYEQMVRET